MPRRKSGDRFRTRYVKNAIEVMGRDEMTARQIIKGMLERGWTQVPMPTQLGMIMRTCGFFDKVGSCDGKVAIWQVRFDKAIERGWLDPEE